MSLFKKPSELETAQTIKALIYGQPGAGKSTLAISAPSPVLFDFDGGVHRVNAFFQCDTLQVKSWEQVIDALKEDLSPYKTIVIDTAGKMLDYMGAYIIKQDSKMGQRDGSLSLKGYGVRKTMFVNFLKQVSIMGKHVVFVAHEKEEKQNEITKVRPEIGGSSAADLIKELDLVGYMQMIGNERTISWTPTEKFYAKNACNLEPEMKIPAIINLKGEPVGYNNFLANVFDSYKSYLDKQHEICSEYDALMDVISENIQSITDVNSANEVWKAIKGYKQIRDSLLRAQYMMLDRTNSLNLKFNKLTKSYEAA